MGQYKADFLREIADSIENDSGWWLGFEVMGFSGWVSPSAPSTIFQALANGNNVRRKPRIVTITGPGGTFEYPEPMREAPEIGDEIYYPFIADGMATCCGDKWDYFLRTRFNRLLSSRLLHSSPGAAQQHARALILAGGGSLDDE